MSKQNPRSKPRSQSAKTAHNARRSVKSTNRKRVLVLLFCLLVAVVIFVSTGGTSRITNQFASAAIEQHNFESAENWLKATDRFSSTEPYHHFLSARIARHRGDLQTMSAELNLAAKYGFDSTRIDLERQLSIAQHGNLSEVEPSISARLAKGGVDLPEICEAYANGLARDSRFDAALEILNAWKSDRPDNPAPRYRIARIQEYLQLFDDAKSNYRSAIDLNADYYPAIYGLAKLLLDENEAKQAADLYRRCLKMPAPAAAKVGLAMSLVKEGETEAAKSLLREVVSLKREEIQQSYASVNEVVERNLAAAELGRILANEGEYDEAIRWLDIALEYNSRDLAARYSRAIALRGLKREEEATSEFELVEQTKTALQKVNSLRNQINRNPEDVASRIELGKLLIAYESERNGLFWLRSALTQAANAPEVHLALAEYYESHLSGTGDNPALARLHRRQFEELSQSAASQQLPTENRGQ